MATLPITCGYCGRDVGAEIVADSAGDAVASRDYKPNPNAILWLRCPSCGQGSVRRSNPIGIVPGTSPGRSLKNLPADVDRARAEARSAHSVTAYTAAEIMCRKILMHLAVDKAKAQPGKTVRPLRGRARESWLHHDRPQTGSRSSPQVREHREPQIAGLNGAGLAHN